MDGVHNANCRVASEQAETCHFVTTELGLIGHLVEGEYVDLPSFMLIYLS